MENARKASAPSTKSDAMKATTTSSTRQKAAKSVEPAAPVRSSSVTRTTRGRNTSTPEVESRQRSASADPTHALRATSTLSHGHNLASDAVDQGWNDGLVEEVLDENDLDAYNITSYHMSVSQKVSGQNYSASNNNMLVKCSMKDVAPASAIQPQGPHPLRPVHVNLQFTPGDFAQLHKEVAKSKPSMGYLKYKQDGKHARYLLDAYWPDSLSSSDKLWISKVQLSPPKRGSKDLPSITLTLTNSKPVTKRVRTVKGLLADGQEVVVCKVKGEDAQQLVPAPDAAAAGGSGRDDGAGSSLDGPVESDPAHSMAAGAADDFLEFQQQLDQLHTSDTLLTSAEVASAGHALEVQQARAGVPLMTHNSNRLSRFAKELGLQSSGAAPLLAQHSCNLLSSTATCSNHVAATPSAVSSTRPSTAPAAGNRVIRLPIPTLPQDGNQQLTGSDDMQNRQFDAPAGGSLSTGQQQQHVAPATTLFGIPPCLSLDVADTVVLPVVATATAAAGVQNQQQESQGPQLLDDDKEESALQAAQYTKQPQGVILGSGIAGQGSCDGTCLGSLKPQTDDNCPEEQLAAVGDGSAQQLQQHALNLQQQPVNACSGVAPVSSAAANAGDGSAQLLQQHGTESQQHPVDAGSNPSPVPVPSAATEDPDTDTPMQQLRQIQRLVSDVLYVEDEVFITLYDRLMYPLCNALVRTGMLQEETANDFEDLIIMTKGHESQAMQVLGRCRAICSAVHAEQLQKAVDHIHRALGKP